MLEDRRVRQGLWDLLVRPVPQEAVQVVVDAYVEAQVVARGQAEVTAALVTAVSLIPSTPGQFGIAA